MPTEWLQDGWKEYRNEEEEEEEEGKEEEKESAEDIEETGEPQVEHINISEESDGDIQERLGDIHQEWCGLYDETNEIE